MSLQECEVMQLWSHAKFQNHKFLFLIFHNCWFCLTLQLTLGVGVYAGMFIAQNYDVPKVDDPEKVIEKIKDFAEQYKKPEK